MSRGQMRKKKTNKSAINNRARLKKKIADGGLCKEEWCIVQKEITRLDKIIKSKRKPNESKHKYRNNVADDKCVIKGLDRCSSENLLYSNTKKR
jgi:hypothetical protein